MASPLDQLLANQPQLLAQMLAGRDAPTSPNLAYPPQVPPQDPKLLSDPGGWLAELGKRLPGSAWNVFVGQPLGALENLGQILMSGPEAEISPSGEISPFDPRLVDSAAELAGSFGGPGALAGSAIRPDPNLLSVFAGPQARTADLINFKIAQQGMKDFQAENRTPHLSDSQVNEIYHSTGWFPGADNLLRFEIPDTTSRARAGLPDAWSEYAQIMERMGHSPVAVPGAGPTERVLQRAAALGATNLSKKTREGTLPQFMAHPELFEAYPELEALRTKVTGQAWEPQSGVNNMDGSIEATGQTQADLMSVLLHEVQHSIQMKEGFGGGGNPNWMGSQLASLVPSAADQLALPTPRQLYDALMGEVEARQVASRYELGLQGYHTIPQGLAPSIDLGVLGMDHPRELQLDPRWMMNPETQPEIRALSPQDWNALVSSPIGLPQVSKNILLDKLKFLKNWNDQQASQGLPLAAQVSK